MMLPGHARGFAWSTKLRIAGLGEGRIANSAPPLWAVVTVT